MSQKRYAETFIGKTCSKCGTNERYTKSKACTLCQRRKHKRIRNNHNTILSKFLRGEKL